MKLPPLGLYIHVPWCLHKCPYCDFNSHAVNVGKFSPATADRYITHVLEDLTHDYHHYGAEREISSIFIGGGTPSVLAEEHIERLLDGIRQDCRLSPNLEITLEANPGVSDIERFRGYHQAGVNRLSLGIQSLNANHLRQLGRIHSAEQALCAVETARSAGFERLNLDLMFGLPTQNLEDALEDLEELIRLQPEHLSWYQLTLERGTVFWQHPPRLPNEDVIAEMARAGQQLLAAQGFQRYEISAYAQQGQECRHNLNYWTYGDYLGLGAGAHGKVSLQPTPNDAKALSIMRYARESEPQRYLDAAALERVVSRETIGIATRIEEFFMNALRLEQGFAAELFTTTTGLAWQLVEPQVLQASQRGLLDYHEGCLQKTRLGRDFLDDLLLYFC